MSNQLAQPSVVMTARQRDAIEVASMLEVNEPPPEGQESPPTGIVTP